MKTKAVYVLTSNRNDYYYEQLLMSVYSLKLRNPDMQTVLVTDTTTNSTFVPGRNKIKEYFDEIIVVDIPKQFGKKQCSRYLKTSLRQYIKGDYLFIDVDTIICDSLSEIDELDVEIGAVPNDHEESQYYNSGVMYSKDTLASRKLYELWHELWLEDENGVTHLDQHSLDLANRRFGYAIKEIPGIWNCMVKSGGSNFLQVAKIVHYYTSCNSVPKFKIEQERCMLILKRDDEINKDVGSFIKNVKICFAYELFLYDVYVDVDYCTTLHVAYPSKYKVLNRLAYVFLFISERSKWLKRKLIKKL